MSVTIGFIGQGWIGKHYADDFEARGYDTVRYALEEPYVQNKDLIKNCDITLIAVPTPTTPEGFDDRIVRGVLSLIGRGKIAIIKSTVTIGKTEELQTAYPDIIVLHSPEFLVEKTAAHDAAHPNRNIVGVPSDSEAHKEAAEFFLRVLPYAPYNVILPAREAEFVKYAGNCFLYSKVVFMNMLYDYAKSVNCDWERVREAMIHDPRIGESHTNPIHSSGRGAGGHCFIKDFEAFKVMYTNVGDELGSHLLEAFVAYNNQLLVNSQKDLDLLKGVYGEERVNKLLGKPSMQS